ncbi:hypothetical protein BDR05DRAFT_950910 [Suillus weaverae]|nr:hypothetical protein BDR05DRAFT_950910 [Suillus weaverae]
MVAPIVNTGIQTSKYCNVAGLGVLIFDYFLTLEPEVRWTWNRRWNVTRVLFVISRYMAFVAAGMTSYGEQLPVSPVIEYSARASAQLPMVINILSSQRFTEFTAAIHIISIVAAEGLLILRTYVFWKQNKKLLAVLLVLAAISIACAVSITQVVNNVAAAPVDPSAPPTSNCTFQAGRSSAIQYGFLVAYELCKDISFQSHLARFFNHIYLVLMSLTVFKRYQDYRDSNSRLVRAVFEGGVRYMTAIISVSVLNILIMSVVPAATCHPHLRESDQEEFDGSTLQMSTFHAAQHNQRNTLYD